MDYTREGHLQIENKRLFKLRYDYKKNLQLYINALSLTLLRQKHLCRVEGEG